VQRPAPESATRKEPLGQQKQGNGATATKGRRKMSAAARAK